MTQTNISTKQKKTHRHREQTCGCQGGKGGEGKNWETGISRCKLVYIGTYRMDKQQGPTV